MDKSPSENLNFSAQLCIHKRTRQAMCSVPYDSPVQRRRAPPAPSAGTFYLGLPEVLCAAYASSSIIRCLFRFGKGKIPIRAALKISLDICLDILYDNSVI